MDTENKMIVESANKIRAAASEALKARDNLLAGGRNLKARQTEIRQEIEDVGAKLRNIKGQKIELVRAGDSTASADAQIKQLRENETALHEELSSIGSVAPVDKEKLKQAIAAIKRATFAAIKTHKPDAGVDALFAAALDFVEAWDEMVLSLLAEFDIRGHMGAYDGDWRLKSQVKLSNPIIERVADFGPYLKQPEPIKYADSVGPAPQTLTGSTGRDVPRGMTPAEAQRNAAEFGRKKNPPKKQYQGQTVAILPEQVEQ